MTESLSTLLASGGDRRIICDANGVNAYGCTPFPQAEVLAYGSVTASTISTTAYRAAEQLLQRLPSTGYKHEMERIRRELIRLCNIEGADIIFAASGTDLHAIAAQLIRPQKIIMIEASETGSGVPAALGSDIITVVRSRLDDGNPRAIASIDAEIEAHAAKQIAAGGKILLVVTDVSKTGLTAPSPACAQQLLKRFGAQVEVLVDACQFRLAPSALHAYLAQGFLVAITGSKFLGGPAFSGALLIPESTAPRLRSHALPDVENIGLLLRWEAALTEFQTFHALPEAAVNVFIKDFAAAIQAKLAADPFVPLGISCPTIFPFLLRRADAWLNRDETKKMYESLRAQGCQLGQPVMCGVRDTIPISALRLSLSARLIVDAVSGRRSAAIINEALGILDKAASMI